MNSHKLTRITKFRRTASAFIVLVFFPASLLRESLGDSLFESRHLSLKEAVATALQKHPSLVRANELHQAAESREREVGSSYLPHIALEAIEKDGPPGAPAFGFRGLANSTIVNHTGGDVVLSQLIYDFGETLHRTRSEHAQALGASAEEQAQRAYVILNVYKAYYNALLAEHEIALADENLSARQVTLKQAKANFDAGLTSRVDVDLAQANLSQAEVQLLETTNQSEIGLAELNAAMGITDPVSYVLEDPSLLETEHPPTSLHDDLLTAFQKRPEIQAARAKVTAANETMQAAKSEGLPVLRALASGGDDNVTSGLAGSNHTYALGVGLLFPLYTGGEVEAKVDEARHQAAALEASQDELAQSIRLEVIRARQALLLLLESRKAARQALVAAKDSRQLATERYHEGLGNMLELDEAELAFFNAQELILRLDYNILTARAALRYALGELWD